MDKGSPLPNVINTKTRQDYLNSEEMLQTEEVELSLNSKLEISIPEATTQHASPVARGLGKGEDQLYKIKLLLFLCTSE